jgi:hypothetical protein
MLRCRSSSGGSVWGSDGGGSTDVGCVASHQLLQHAQELVIPEIRDFGGQDGCRKGRGKEVVRRRKKGVE